MSTPPPPVHSIYNTPSSTTAPSSMKSFTDHWKKVSAEKSPPFTSFRSYIHEALFIANHMPDQGLNIAFHHPFQAAHNCQASVQHETSIAFSPGMGMKPTAQHTLGFFFASQLGQFNIQTQAPHFSTFNFGVAASPFNKKLTFNLNATDGVMQGTPNRSIGGTVTYRGPDYTTQVDMHNEQNFRVKAAFMKQLTDSISAGSSWAYNQNPRCTDLTWVAHYLDGDKNSPKFLVSMEHRVEDDPETALTFSPSQHTSRCALLQRFNANTYGAAELTLRWTKQEAKLKYALRQTWPAGGEMRVQVEDNLRIKAFFSQEINQTVSVGLVANCSPNQDDYKFGVQINVVDSI